jgi:hypothetical protein
VAQQVLIKLEDDLDGGDANETLTFGLDGVSYEIDLSDAHAAELRDELASYVAAARRIGGRKVQGAGNGQSAPSGDRERAKAIREWARGAGIDVSARGRISAELAAQYEEAQRAPVVAEEPAPRKRAPRKKVAAK